MTGRSARDSGPKKLADVDDAVHETILNPRLGSMNTDLEPLM